jgi:hypothetical protein
VNPVSSSQATPVASLTAPIPALMRMVGGAGWLGAGGVTVAAAAGGVALASGLADWQPLISMAAPKASGRKNSSRFMNVVVIGPEIYRKLPSG